MSFFKVVCFVIFLFVVEACASCIQYGHACWGGHGKRGNNLAEDRPERVAQEWFLSRLVRPEEVATLFREDKEEEERSGGDLERKDKDDLYTILQSRQQSSH